MRLWPSLTTPAPGESAFEEAEIVKRQNCMSKPSLNKMPDKQHLLDMCEFTFSLAVSPIVGHCGLGFLVTTNKGHELILLRQTASGDLAIGFFFLIP